MLHVYKVLRGCEGIVDVYVRILVVLGELVCISVLQGWVKRLRHQAGWQQLLVKLWTLAGGMCGDCMSYRDGLRAHPAYAA